MGRHSQIFHIQIIDLLAVPAIQTVGACNAAIAIMVVVVVIVAVTVFIIVRVAYIIVIIIARIVIIIIIIIVIITIVIIISDFIVVRKMVLRFVQLLFDNKISVNILNG